MLYLRERGEEKVCACMLEFWVSGVFPSSRAPHISSRIGFGSCLNPTRKLITFPTRFTIVALIQRRTREMVRCGCLCVYGVLTSSAMGSKQTDRFDRSARYITFFARLQPLSFYSCYGKLCGRVYYLLGSTPRHGVAGGR